MSTRRQALRGLSLLASASGASLARAAGPTKRIGVLAEASRAPSTDAMIWEPELWQRLARRGWVVGQNVAVVRAIADTKTERLPALAQALVHQRVDLIVCDGDQEAMVAAAQATRTVPIVAFEVLDPVEQGLADSFARPGRNFTGISLQRGPDLAMKRLQYLRAIAPSARRLCWLWGHDTSMATRVDGSRYDAAELLAAAARRMQFEPRIHHVTNAVEIDKALAEAAAWKAEAVTSSGLPPFLARERIARVALDRRWPSAFAAPQFVQAGGLLSFAVPGSEIDALTERWVDYIDRALRGAQPAEMPIIGADRYELKINAKTAQELGLSIPESILARADEVVR